MKWVNTSKLDNPKEGITDELHKVVEEITGKIKEYYQYELHEDLNCKLFKLGFTVDEVKKIIAEDLLSGGGRRIKPLQIPKIGALKDISWT